MVDEQAPLLNSKVIYDVFPTSAIAAVELLFLS
jgi:hypothetical protein